MNAHRVSVPALALTAVLTTASHGQTLDLTLTESDQTVTEGTTVVVFDAIVTNPSTSTLYLNGDSSTTSSTLLKIDDSPFFANAPIDLAPGASSGVFTLFDVDVAKTATTGLYGSNVFSILGGADGGTLSAFSDLADAQFSVTLTTATNAAPELEAGSAGSFLTLLFGSLAVACAKRPWRATAASVQKS